MPLFLRALPLSLMTLWHYVFVLPLVLIVCLPFLILTQIPILGWPVAVAVGTFISFAGYRCALAALGRGNEPSPFRLVKSSFTLGIINTFGSIVLMIVAVGVGHGLIRLGFSDAVAVPALFAVPYSGGLAAAAYLVLISLFSCAMAVPMTAVAHAATTKGRDPDPFFGFGAGLFSLLVSWGAWLAGFYLLGFAERLFQAIIAGIAILMAKALQIPLEEPIEIDWIALATSVLYLLWGACWFCATAVLAWDRKMKRRVAVPVVVEQRPRISAEDLRALRESRMPETRDIP